LIQRTSLIQPLLLEKTLNEKQPFNYFE
jgi:hypothetical protein